MTLYDFKDHPDHQARLGEWADKWIANAMSTAPADQTAMRSAMTGLYDAANLEPPTRGVFVKSPMTAAIAGSIAAGVWWIRDNPGQHAKLFGHVVSEAELLAALRVACAVAVDRGMATLRGEEPRLPWPPAATEAATRDATEAATWAATRDATEAATEAATRDATRAATRAATGAATGAATRAATGDATWDATWDATGDATWDATWDATRAATGDATGDATEAATWDATGDATWDATEAATRDATEAATWAATRAATRDATWAATWDATWDATEAATEDATWDATRAATWDATRAATWAATRAATGAATGDATWAATEAATWDATGAATWDATGAATEAATRDATEAATWAATRDATRAATGAATGDATRAATGAATWAATGAATRAATWAATWAATGAATRAATGDATGDATWAATRAATGDATGDATGAATRAATGDATGDATRDATEDATEDATVINFLLQCPSGWYRMHDGGSDWSHYPAYLSFFDRVANLNLAVHDKWRHYEAAAANGASRMMHKRFWIVSDRQVSIHVDPQARLHHETGPARTWGDGWAIYAWHGVRVPADLIEDGWDTARILKEPNAEVRRCAIERLGWERFVVDAGLAQVGESVPDPGNPGHTLALYDVPEAIYDTAVRVLICDNATPERDGTRRRFGLTVPASMPDPVAAAAWTFGLNPSEYAALERAS